MDVGAALLAGRVVRLVEARLGGRDDTVRLGDSDQSVVHDIVVPMRVRVRRESVAGEGVLDELDIGDDGLPTVACEREGDVLRERVDLQAQGGSVLHLAQGCVGVRAAAEHPRVVGGPPKEKRKVGVGCNALSLVEATADREHLPAVEFVQFLRGFRVADEAKSLVVVDEVAEAQPPPKEGRRVEGLEQQVVELGNQTLHAVGERRHRAKVLLSLIHI